MLRWGVRDDLRRRSRRAAPGPSALEARLAEINPDDLTPKTALELIYELRALLRDAGAG